ncbi:hypothetical protein H5410_002895 [Solanum commersonii]|uniref:Reverse transcriptase n=1 Tax=Solanum commersonii TaxID=4109 RepID=A0A9J6B3L5_SOLCO|nr:hypothetical protein H5410_002895 [Solanum commersonii]
MWSKKTHGDIFQQLIIREFIVRIKEKIFEEDPNVINRVVLQSAQAKFKRYLHFEEIFWQQKACYDWFEQGDIVTRFFQNLVKERRKRLQLKRIRLIRVSKRHAIDFHLLRYIPNFINAKENLNLCKIPNLVLDFIKNVGILLGLIYLLWYRLFFMFLSKALNTLFQDVQFVGFSLPRWSDPPNHLTYVDDTIIYT